jgi:hypothetical protein
LPDETASTQPSQDVAEQDVWSKTLTQVPTSFGKLVYLASLRNGNSGKYQHYGLAQIYGLEQSDSVLRQSHEDVFAGWLNLNLEQQRGDLEDFLDQIDDDRATVLRSWERLTPYRELPPSAAGDAERYLFVSDLEVILELLRSDSSSSSPALPA